MKKNKCLFPGTFDPFTNGHLEVLKQALNDFDQVHIIIMENTQKTPLFNLDTRLDIINSLNQKNIIVGYWDGWATQYCKENSIHTIVRGYRNHQDLKYEKDLANVYKQCWPKVTTKLYKTNNTISSTQIKKLIKEKKDVSHLIPWKDTTWKED